VGLLLWSSDRHINYLERAQGHSHRSATSLGVLFLERQRPVILSRRSLLIGAASALAAPAIVRAESLMKVKAIVPVRQPLLIYESTPGWSEPMLFQKYWVSFKDQTIRFLPVTYEEPNG
jgi:hypothetical protein